MERYFITAELILRNHMREYQNTFTDVIFISDNEEKCEREIERLIQELPGKEFTLYGNYYTCDYYNDNPRSAEYGTFSVNCLSSLNLYIKGLKTLGI